MRPGLAQLEALVGIPVLGVVPWMDLDIDDEDSVSSRLEARHTNKPIDVAVIHLPRISNFTDFTALDQHPALGLRYVSNREQLAQPDLLIIPGTKNTMEDLLWLRQNGLETAIKKLAASGAPILGICGGYQMLGRTIADPDGVEAGGEMRGLDLLPTVTTFTTQKTRSRVSGRVNGLDGFFSHLSGAKFVGYEIHVGQTECMESVDGRS